jgi:hypothetical protein
VETSLLLPWREGLPASGGEKGEGDLIGWYHIFASPPRLTSPRQKGEELSSSE